MAFRGGRCFPGSHASTGFALMAFYFVLFDTRPRLARVLLAAAVALGTIFSVGQQARGSHFLSHDLTSAALAWFELLGLWWLLLRSPAARSRLIPDWSVRPTSGYERPARSGT